MTLAVTGVRSRRAWRRQRAIVLQAQPTGRLTVIISDLHLGSARIRRPGSGIRRRIFAGRTRSARSCAPSMKPARGRPISCSTAIRSSCGSRSGPSAGIPTAAGAAREAEALIRLERVLAAHATEIARSRRVRAARATTASIVVPGDHDAALFFAPLSQRVVCGLERARARGGGDTGILGVGGRRGLRRARTSDWPAIRFASAPGRSHSIRDAEARAHLERTWGEQLLQGVYDRQEPRYPILDNVVEAGAGLKYLATADPAALRAAGIGPLLKFFASRTPWQQFRLDLDGGDVQPPEWDLPATRQRGAAFLVESLVPDDRLRGLAEGASRRVRCRSISAS